MRKIKEHEKQTPDSAPPNKAFDEEKLSRALFVKLVFMRALGLRPYLRDLTGFHVTSDCDLSMDEIMLQDLEARENDLKH